MARPVRIPRRPEDLAKELVEQLQLLRSACRQYDLGFQAAAKHIALTLRLLLHHHARSNSLLHQLKLLGIDFLDTAGPLKPDNHAPEHKLVAFAFTKKWTKFLPLIATGGNPENQRSVPFDQWWPEPVLKDSKGNVFSRQELVLHVADTDGGAHVDPELDEAYMCLSRRNSIGGTYQSSEGTVPFDGRPELACIRQIAHELLSSLHVGTSAFAVHAHPVIPEETYSADEQVVIVQYVEVGGKNPQ